MNADVKAKWVAALRSGEYAQARQMLQRMDGDGFCCLGVLCDLHAKETGAAWKEQLATWDSHKMALAYYGADSSLPLVVSVWAGFEFMSSDPEVEYDGGRAPLSAINDGGQPFAFIARLIEEQL